MRKIFAEVITFVKFLLLAALVVGVFILLIGGIASLFLCFVGDEYGPYINYGSDSFTTMRISWVSATEIETYIEYWPASNVSDVHIFSNSTPTRVHHVELNNLLPDTEYYYRVKFSGGMSEVFSFKTASNSTTSFSFVVYGDTRRGFAETHFATIRLIKKLAPDFVVNVGDVVLRGADENEWRRFLSEIDDIASTKPYMVAIGNHEFGGEPKSNPTHFMKYMFYPNTGLYYSFDYGNAHFVVLNISCIYSDHYPNDPQREWLKQDLENATNRGVHWIFVFFHVPPYSSGESGDDVYVQQYYIPILKNYSVDAVFVGHDHHYEHIYNDNIHYFIVGCGGADLEVKLEPHDYTIYYEDVHGVCNVIINGSEAIIKAYRIDGSIMEYFVLKG